MKTDFLVELFGVFNEKINYAVLRNFEGLPENYEGRDIDLLIPLDEWWKIVPDFVSLCDKHDCRILYTNRDNQFLTVVLCDGAAQVFQLDIQFNFAWMGVDLLDELDVLKHRVFSGKVWHLDPMYSFLPKYLYSRILGAKYPAKYSGVRDAAFSVSGKEIEELLNTLSCGKGGFEFWERASKWRLRFLALLAGCRRNFFRTVWRQTEFILRYNADLFRRRGLMISFSGPDGCGKTTVIGRLMEHLEVNPPLLFHFRPTLFPNLGEVGHKAGVVKNVDREFDKPHRSKRKGKLNSFVRLCYYTADYIVGYMVKILPLRQRKHIVIFDRYFTDIIADSRRSSIYLDVKFLAFWRHLVPACRYNIFFRVEPETIRSRKTEMDVEDMKEVYRKLEYLVSVDRRSYFIDNNSTPQDAVVKIFDLLRNKQHPEYVKKLY